VSEDPRYDRHLGNDNELADHSPALGVGCSNATMAIKICSDEGLNQRLLEKTILAFP
jgi:hypothetical protein